MNIGITSFGADGGKSGISQYVIQLLSQFCGMGGANRFELYVCDSERDLFPTAGAVSPLLLSDRLRRPLASVAWHQLRLPSWCRRRRHDVLFLPAGNRRLPCHVPCPTVGTVHDLSSLHVQGKYDWARGVYIRHVLPMLIRRLTRVTTISHSSKRDIVEHAGVDESKVRVIPLAVDHQRFQPRDPAPCRRRVEQLLGAEGPFVLYISRLEHPGKNHVRLIEAFQQVKRKHGVPHKLLLVGSDWTRAGAVHEAAAGSPAAEDILLPGFVSGEHLADLYNAADAHVFPSLYEGFGLPILEAMASGVPTACSDCSSMPEVAGDAAELFDPRDVDAIADSLSRLLLDEHRRQQLVERGLARAQQYHWRRTAEETLELIEEAARC